MLSMCILFGVCVCGRQSVGTDPINEDDRNHIVVILFRPQCTNEDQQCSFYIFYDDWWKMKDDD